MTIAVFTGDFDRGRQFGNTLDPVFGSEPGIIAGACCQNQHTVHLLKHFSRILAEQGRAETGVIDQCFDGIGQCARLFVDFLLHEMCIRTQLHRCQRHIAQMNPALNPGTVAAINADALALDAGNVAIFQIDDLARYCQDGRNIGGNKIFAIAQTD